MSRISTRGVYEYIILRWVFRNEVIGQFCEFLGSHAEQRLEQRLLEMIISRSAARMATEQGRGPGDAAESIGNA